MAINQTPGNIVIGAVSTLTLGGTDLGPVTEDGVEISVEQSHFDHKNDQVKGTVKKTLTDRKCMIRFSLTEPSLANVHRALNEAAASLSASTLTLDDTNADEAELIIVAPSAGGAGSSTRTYTFDKVVQVGNVSLNHSKSNEQTAAFEFEAIYDTADSRFATFVDAA